MFRLFLFVPLVCGLFACVASADDHQQARRLVERALKARGIAPDAPELVESWTDTGKMTFQGQEMPYVARWTFQPPNKMHFVMDMKFQGQDMKVVATFNGVEGWESALNMTRPVVDKKLEVLKHETYQLWLTSLLPLLKDQEFKLSILPEKAVNGQPAQGIKVTRPGHRDVSLYFDRETGHFIKFETTTLDEFQGWKEVKDEAYFSDYQDVNGIKCFMKMKVHRDGKPLLDSVFSDHKRFEKADPKLFEKP